MTIAERVKALRKAEGLTQEQLARALFVTDGAISHIERGNRRPSKLIAMKLAARYNKSTDYFLLDDSANESQPVESRVSEEALALGKRIYAFLSESNITVPAAAKRLGLSTPEFKKYLDGEMEPPAFMIIRLVMDLGMSPADVLAGKSEAPNIINMSALKLTPEAKLNFLKQFLEGEKCAN